MMTGNSRVRASPRQRFASAKPDWPGSIQSRMMRSGSTPSTAACACSAVAAIVTSKPACRRLIEISSAMADSSSTTRMWLIDLPHVLSGRAPGRSQAGPHPLGGSAEVPVGRGASFHQRLDIVHRVVAHVGALDDVDDLLGQVLRVIADALDRLRDEHEVDA